MDWLDGTALESIPGAVHAGLAAGLLLPVLGLWVVLQRVVFLGVTLAQVAAAGVALALVLGLPVLPMGLAACLAVVAVVIRDRPRPVAGQALMGDGSLGALFCVASALALLFVSRSPADLDEVQHVLHGNLIYADGDDVLLTAGVLAAGVAVLVLAFRPLLLVGFDRETAAALGLRPGPWLGLLFGVLALSLSVSMRTTGSLLTFALLVLPALASLALGRGLVTSFVLASLLGAGGTLAGLLLAVHADLHVESSITVACAAVLVSCLGWARHPLVGLGLAAAAVTAGLSLAPAAPAELHDDAHRHHHEEPGDAPWHADLVLSARRDGSERLEVSWELVLEVREPGSVPHDLWVLLTGEGVLHEHLVAQHLDELPAGTHRQRGSCSVPAPAGVHRLEGQLWTGSMEQLDALPLTHDQGAVIGTDVGP